jgi:hypothetical protein
LDISGVDSTFAPAGDSVSHVQASPERFTLVVSICLSGLK